MVKDAYQTKPDNWESLKSHELTQLIHELNVWNANQPKSDAWHNKHYKNEILPLVKRRDLLNKQWIEKGSNNENN